MNLSDIYDSPIKFPFFGRIALIQLLRDPTVWVLVFANLFAILFAVIYNWSFLELMLVYWGQSVIIGFFYFLKLVLSAAKPTPITIEVGTNKHTFEGGVAGAITFAITYGFFHLFYLVFMVFWFGFFGFFSENQAPLDVVASRMLFAISVFFVAHAFSFVYYFLRARFSSSSVEEEASNPFDRILAMHLCIWFAGVLVHPFGVIMIAFLAFNFFRGYTAQNPAHRHRATVWFVGMLLLAVLLLIFFKSILLLVVVSLIKTTVDVLSHCKKHQLTTSVS